MKAKLPILLAAFALTAIALPADAKTKKHVRPAPQAASTFSSTAPARMIEVRPGVWVSSYSCVTDDGYGRLLPCALGDGIH